jgi:hypothetical protein
MQPAVAIGEQYPTMQPMVALCVPPVLQLRTAKPPASARAAITTSTMAFRGELQDEAALLQSIDAALDTAVAGFPSFVRPYARGQVATSQLPPPRTLWVRLEGHLVHVGLSPRGQTLKIVTGTAPVVIDVDGVAVHVAATVVGDTVTVVAHRDEVVCTLIIEVNDSHAMVDVVVTSPQLQRGLRDRLRYAAP